MYKKNLPKGAVCPGPGSKYMYMTIIFLNIFSEITWPIKAKFHVESMGRVKNVYMNGPGHMTKMATMPIYGNLQTSSTELIVL